MLDHADHIVLSPGLEKKFWGVTSCIYHDAHFQVHRVMIVPGGYCSRHHHIAKFNEFYVMQGKLLVHHYRDGEDEPFDTKLLQANDKLTVPPLLWHRFEALDEPVHALEIYWLAGIHPNDIIRSDEGGVNDGVVESRSIH